MYCKKSFKKFTVGTESAKKIIHCYSDPSLMRPLLLLPNLATKSVRKRGMESTHHIGIQNITQRRKRKKNIKMDSAILCDTIGEATVLKYTPNDTNVMNIDKNEFLRSKRYLKCKPPSTKYSAKASKIKTESKKCKTKVSLSCEDKLSIFGKVIDVPADGNCGFHSIMSILNQKGYR